MPLLIGFSSQALAPDTWVGGMLLLSCFALVCLARRRAYFPFGSSRGSNLSPGPRAEKQERHPLKTETKENRSQSQSIDKSVSDQVNGCSLQKPTTKKRTRWDTEKTMRVLSSIIILASAIYIIVFDQSASEDKQKWAFGAVGLVFGHWSKTN